MNNRIGFMQGRLSPMVDGVIQAFPWSNWKEEFSLAEEKGFHLMEWTLDQDRLYDNPLLMPDGQSEILSLCQRYQMKIQSLTGDCFMQAPFWKMEGENREALQRDFDAVINACIAVGISTIVIPLVDNGRIEQPEEEDILVDFLLRRKDYFASNDLHIVFESDYVPVEYNRFMERLASDIFGVNYDIGNSAALGFEPREEINLYGKRIMNVHVKDRPLHGTTVPLGTGDADFETVFALLSDVGYSGNYILQTARSDNNDHAGVLCHYRDMTNNWLSKYAA